MTEPKVSSIEVNKLVFSDLEITCRSGIPQENVSRLMRAYQAGQKWPPILVDRKTKRIVDGVCRATAAQRLELTHIEAIFEDFKNDAEIFLRSIAENRHGEPLNPYDLTFCICRAEKLGVSLDELAIASGNTVEHLTELGFRKRAFAGSELLPIKRSIHHLHQTKLTPLQVEGNRRTIGVPQVAMVNHVINLFEHDILDLSSPTLQERLWVLKDYLDGFLASQKKSAKKKRGAV